MPNIVNIILSSEHLCDLDVFSLSKEKGRYRAAEFYFNKIEFNFNKIIKCPSYVRDTISSVKIEAILSYLIDKEQDINMVWKTVDAYPELVKKVPLEYRLLSLEELSEELPKTYELSEKKKIDAVELGSNYLKAHEKTGCWDWYEWSIKNWGTKWNAFDTEIIAINKANNKIMFNTANSYPKAVFEKMTELFPNENFVAEIHFEDDTNIYYNEFGQGYYREYFEKTE